MSTFIVNEPKYPRILVDETVNVPITISMATSVEKDYDYMHHSHYIEDLPSKKAKGESFNSLASKVKELQEEVNTLKDKLNGVKQSTPIIGDYDVKTPGIQDADGNTVETVPINGMTIKEIKK